MSELFKNYLKEINLYTYEKQIRVDRIHKFLVSFDQEIRQFLIDYFILTNMDQDEFLKQYNLNDFKKIRTNIKDYISTDYEKDANTKLQNCTSILRKPNWTKLILQETNIKKGINSNVLQVSLSNLSKITKNNYPNVAPSILFQNMSPIINQEIRIKNKP